MSLLPGYRRRFFARLWQTPFLGEVVMATTTRAGFRIPIQRGNPRRLPTEFVDSMFDCFDAGTKRAVLRLYRATNNPTELADSHSGLRQLFLAGSRDLGPRTISRRSYGKSGQGCGSRSRRPLAPRRRSRAGRRARPALLAQGGVKAPLA
jgi:hypothetical protein